MAMEGPPPPSEPPPAAAAESAVAEPKAEPWVIFWHVQDQELWGRQEEALRAFSARCRAGQLTGLEEAMQGVGEIRALCSGGRDQLRAFAKACGQAPQQSICDEKKLLEVVLPWVASQAAELPRLFKDGLPRLLTGQARQVFLSRRKCAALLASSLFGVLPNPDVQEKNQVGECQMPGFDLHFVLEVELPKCHCLLSYFVQLAEADEAFLEEQVSFCRRVLSQELPGDYWRGLEKPLMPASVQVGAIEDSHGNLQADFANEFLGGGVLHGGNVQEEIRFSVCPECLVGMLFCEKMAWNEAIFIVGAQQFSRYAGYGGSFRFAGVHREVFRPERDSQGRVGPHIAALDALVFPGERQYEEGLILRELNKSFAACSGDLQEEEAFRCKAFATGNWGCGVFGGDPQLKALIQLLSASAAGRELAYFPFGDRRVEELPQVLEAISKRGLLCKDLYALLQGRQPGCVFEGVLRDLSPSES